MSDNAETTKKTSLDIASVIGLILAITAILGGQALEGGKVGSLLQSTAALIVLGGTFGACLLQFPLAVALKSFKSVIKAFQEPKTNNKEQCRYSQSKSDNTASEAAASTHSYSE